MNKEHDAELAVKRKVNNLSFDEGVLTEFDGKDYPNLLNLVCSSRQCKELNLEENSRLIMLNCSINLLLKLDLSNCEELVYLDCSFNVIHELLLPAAGDLQVIDCSDNRLVTLDLSGCTDLSELYCDDNLDLKEIHFPTKNGSPIRMEFLDLSETALTPEWLLKQKNFPLPEEGMEDQLFIFNSPLADSPEVVVFLEKRGWQPQNREE